MKRIKLAFVLISSLAMLVAVTPAVGATPTHDEVGLVDQDTGIWHLRDGVVADLTGATEVPGPGDADGSGKAFVNLDSAGGWVCFSIDHKGIDGTVTAAHIHRGAAGVSGGVEISLDYPANGNEGCVKAASALIAEIDGNKAGFYVNVHSTAFPAGAIRGQLKNGTATSFYFGNPGDMPFMGDWDGDGVDTPGLFRQSDGFVYLRNSNTAGPADISYFFGNPDDVALAGDFDGNGRDTVSLYRPSEAKFYISNKLGPDGGALGPADFSFTFGNPGDEPIVGDWDGDGDDTIGVRRPSTGQILERNSNSAGNADNTLIFGDPGDAFVGGDWDGNPTDTPGLFRSPEGKFYQRNSNTTGVADSSFFFGNGGWVPIAGHRVPEAPGLLVDLQLLAFNDYHGHLESTTPGMIDGVAAGGAEYLSAMLTKLRDGKKNSLTVAAGDLIGGSPAFSGLFHDEPSVESLNAMHLDVSGVGNHEFDEGVTELLRMQNGGCHPVDGCYFPAAPYPGADFQWLAANTVNTTTGATPLPPYWVKNIDNVKVGFIGMTLEATNTLVAAAGIQGWDFRDEADTANALVPKLKAEGVEAIVVLLHEGGSQTPPPGAVDACVGISGPVVAINNALDAEIDVLITGHTHLPYNCVLPDAAGQPRIVTSAFSYGRVVSELKLVLDKRTNDVRRDLSTATNHTVDQASLTPDPVQTAIIAKWQPLVDAAADTPIGTITETIFRGGTPPGSDRGVESAAGNLVADAQQWSTSFNGAQVAFMNPGGVRSDLTYPQSGSEGDGVVTFGEAFTFQPFGNTLKTFPMTGAQIVSALEEQCQPLGSSRPFLHLGVSDGFTYDLAKTIVAGDCTSVAVTNVKLNGVALDPAATYIVTVNSFLSDGGDNFATFNTITAPKLDGGNDLQALANYLGTFSPVAPPSIDRVNEL
jgi:5'-nucleotidase